VFSDTIYNAFGNSNGNHNIWLWGDGFQNSNLDMACHTYLNSGDYTITRRDTLKRYTANNPYCVAEITSSIHVIPDVVASFTFLTGGTIVDFTSTSTDADSVWWDFGDTLAGSSQTSVLHTYPTIGTYAVWLYA